MKSVLSGAVLLLMTFSAALCSTKSLSGQYDLLIKNATIVDGTGAPGFRGHVLVKDGVIEEVGEFNITGVEATQIIDAEGRVLSPGFIDTHSHGNPMDTPRFDNFFGNGCHHDYPRSGWKQSRNGRPEWLDESGG